jgi:TrmH family RNA methyltransferase
VLDAARAAGVPVHAVVTGGLARVVDATTPQPIAASARRRAVDLDAIDEGAPALVLASIADPGNAGTLLRSAEAAGFGAVLFTAGSVDPFAPKCVRASAGSLFRIDVVIGGGAGTVLQELAARGRHRLGTSATDGTSYDAVDLPAPLALVLGNEAHGLPADVAAEIDSWVSIPMAGGTESLNVAMAGTLLCFEVARRGSAGV